MPSPCSRVKPTLRSVAAAALLALLAACGYKGPLYMPPPPPNDALAQPPASVPPPTQTAPAQTTPDQTTQQ